MLYELRKYEVMPGRMPALLDRFATFTTLKWKEYDVRLTGFWTPEIGGHNHQLIYILAWNSLEERFKNFGAWQASPERAKKWAETEANGPLVRRVDNSLHEPTAFSQLDNGIPYGPAASGRSPYYFELREYDAAPGKLPNVVKRFGGFTIDCFKKYGFRQVGYWTPLIAGSNQRLTYILAWESHEERIKQFKAFRADPDRVRVFAESEKDGVLVERVTSTMLEAAAFSPMK